MSDLNPNNKSIKFKFYWLWLVLILIGIVIFSTILFAKLNSNLVGFIMDNTILSDFYEDKSATNIINQIANDTLNNNYQLATPFKDEWFKSYINLRSQTIFRMGILKFDDIQVEVSNMRPLFGDDTGMGVIMVQLDNVSNPLAQKGFKAINHASTFFKKLPPGSEHSWRLYGNFLTGTPTYETSWQEGDIKYYLGEYILSDYRSINETVNLILYLCQVNSESKYYSKEVCL